MARRAREDRLRALHTGDRRGPHRPGRGAGKESGSRGQSGAARVDGCLPVRRPVAGPLLVEQSPEARGAGTPAGQGLALPEAEVRFGPHGSAPQGALRARWLEDGQDGASVLPASGRGPAPEGAREPPQRSHLIAISGNQLAGTNWREFRPPSPQLRRSQNDANLRPPDVTLGLERGGQRRARSGL